MIIKEFTLGSALPDQIFTEIMYEVASAWSDRADLVRINFISGDTEKKIVNSAVKILKKMKADGRIQFFATKEGFISSSTEAVFLNNKYPEHFSSSENSDSNFIYIKL